MIALISFLQSISIWFSIIGGIISFIWLAINGVFWPSAISIFIGVAGYFIVPFALLICGGFIAIPAVNQLKKGNSLNGYFLSLTSLIVQYIFIFIWYRYIFYSFVTMHFAYNVSIIPFMVLGFSTAIYPFQAMASRPENSNDTAGYLMTVFFTVGSFLHTILTILGVSPTITFIGLVIPLLVGLVINFIAVVESNARSPYKL